MQSIFMVALLVFGAVSAVYLAAPQTASAAVTMTSSSASWYGPGFIRVLITDTSLDETGDTITPTVEAREGNTLLGSISPTIEAIGGSGTFELFITTSDAPLVPGNPTKTIANGGVALAVNGPFIVRIFDGATAGLTTVAPGAGEDVNQGVPGPAHGSNDYGLDFNDFLDDGNRVRILYGGQTLTLNFDDQAATIISDRAEAGDNNKIVLTLRDRDADLDPTVVDRLTFDDPVNEHISITTANTITYGDAEWVETGQNTGQFELTITVDNTDTVAVPVADNILEADFPTGNSFTARDFSVYEDDGLGATVAGATAPYDTATSESGTSSVSVTLRNRDGSVLLLESPTFANGLAAQVSDSDANISMGNEDDINSGEVTISVDFNGDGDTADAGESDDFNFTETNDGTGVFLPDFSDDRIRIKLGAAGNIDGTNGIITLSLASIQDGRDIVLTYADPAFQSNSQFSLRTDLSTTAGTLGLDLATTGINDIITLRLNDPDLNTDSETVQTYIISAATDGEFIVNGVTVGTLDITAADVDLNMATTNVEATFIETGADTGIFEADDIDMDDVNADPGVDLDDGDEVEFTYDDLMEDPSEDDDVSVTIGRPDAGIDTDRSTIPVPTPGDEVTIVLTVFDTNANTNPGSVETVVVPFATIKTKDGNGDTDTGNADVTALTGLTGDITLTETGPNSGIFQEDVDLEPTTGDIDRLRNTRVTFEYDGETTSVTYRSFDGIITASPQVVSPGNAFTVKVVDQDENKDPDRRETLQVAFETDEDTDEGTACIGGIGACLTLDETGPNTGIFEEIVEVGVDIEVANVAQGDFSTEINLTYNDAITSSGDEDEERELTVRVATGTGTLSRMPEKVGPGTEITVQLGDLDLNENPNGRDEVDDSDDLLEINSSDGDKGNLGAEETAPNTGVFEFTVQFEPRDVDEDGQLSGSGDEWTYTVLPGDIIAIQYTDETDSLGNKVLVSMIFEIISEDPEMVAAEPTVQPGESILLTVTDADANQDGDSQDSIDIDITSDTNPIGFTLAALETGDNTGVFTVTIPTSLTVSSGSIAVRTGGSVFLEYEDEFPADYEDRVDMVRDPSRTFTLVVPVGTPVGNVNSTTPKAPVLTDISGNTLTEVTVGQQVVLNVSIKNNNAVPQSFAGVVEVKDSDGFTVYLQWQTGTLNPTATVDIGLSFVPSEADHYTARTYVLSSIRNPTVLSTVATSTFTVS